MSSAESHQSSKARLVGFLALGALLVILAIAFLPERVVTTGPASSAAPSSPSGATAAGDLPAASRTAPPRESRQAERGTTISTTMSDIALNPRASLLAERFLCVCGCKDILATCSCKQSPGSRDMKLLLQRLVDEGKTPSEIRSEMVAAYGQGVLP